MLMIMQNKCSIVAKSFIVVIVNTSMDFYTNKGHFNGHV